MTPAKKAKANTVTAPIAYRCPACKGMILRRKDQKWVKSWCIDAQRTVHAMRAQP
jgi:hypothetical protein